MRNNKSFKKICILLASVMILSTASGCAKQPVSRNQVIMNELNGTEYIQQEYTAKPGSVKKQETVYVGLSSSGNVRDITVTDWIHTDSPQVRVEDVSNLYGIRNVKTLTNPVLGDGMLYWDMDTTDLYYSGSTDRQPPVRFIIKYYLNGKEMHAEDMAGLSGEVKIVIKTDNTLRKKYPVAGELVEMCCPMLMAGGMILPEDHFTNIAIDNGTTISDGSKQVVFFAGIPGIDESLGLSSLNVNLGDNSFYSSTYTITAQTDCFEMGNMMFAVMPFSAVSSFVGAMGGNTFPDTIESAKEMIADLQKMQVAMQGLDLKRIIDLLYGDTNKIEDMMNAVSEASQLYNENEKLIKTLAKYSTEENFEKLDKLAADLDNPNVNAAVNALATYSPELRQALAVISQASASFQTISTLAKDLNDVMPILQALAADMEDPEIQEQVKRLPQTVERLKKVLDVVQANEELLKALANVADSDGTEQLEVLVQTAGKYAGLGTLTDAQAELLAEKMRAWLTFGAEYNIFTQKTPDMDSSVMFTYKTDAITAPVKASSAPKQEADSGNKLVSWFKKLFD